MSTPGGPPSDAEMRDAEMRDAEQRTPLAPAPLSNRNAAGASSPLAFPSSSPLKSQASSVRQSQSSLGGKSRFSLKDAYTPLTMLTFFFFAQSRSFVATTLSDIITIGTNVKGSEDTACFGTTQPESREPLAFEQQRYQPSRRASLLPQLRRHHSTTPASW